MPKLVKVTWGDAWESSEDIGHRPWMTYSVGWIVERNKKGIRLGACIDEDGELSRFLYIPAGMVVRVEVL